MRVAGLAGIPVDIEPDETLSEEEREALSALPADADAGREALRLRIENVAPEAIAPREEGLRAGVTWEGATLRLAHHTFEATLDLSERLLRARRSRAGAGQLALLLRVGLSTLLPLDGDLPLHAAAALTEAGAVVFFGPSGAGKTTISRCVPLPFLSDELVVLRPEDRGASVRATQIWGSLHLRPSPPGPHQVRALIELARGSERLSLERLDSSAATRRIAASSEIPPVPHLWERALEIAGALARRVPVYRMRWKPEKDPWPQIAAALRRDGV